MLLVLNSFSDFSALSSRYSYLNGLSSSSRKSFMKTTNARKLSLIVTYYPACNSVGTSFARPGGVIGTPWGLRTSFSMKSLAGVL